VTSYLYADDYRYAVGTVAAGVAVTFYADLACTQLATLTDSVGGALANPRTTDGAGFASAYCTVWPLYYKASGDLTGHRANCLNPPPASSGIPSDVLHGDGLWTPPNDGLHAVYYEHELFTPVSYPWSNSILGAGTTAYPSGLIDHPGVVQFKSSTTPNSGNALALAGVPNTPLGLSGTEVFHVWFRPQVLALSTLYYGLHNSGNQVTPTQGVWASIVAGLITGRVCDNAGTVYNTGTTYQCVTNTWYHLVITTGPTVQTFALYTSEATPQLLWTSTVAQNVPATLGVTAACVSTNSGSAAVAIVDLDRISLAINRVFAR
jgi:hypothetical protein